MKIKTAVALGLGIAVLFVGTKYDKIIEVASADPVPFVLVPVLGVGALLLWRKFAHRIPDGDMPEGKKRTRPNKGDW